MTFPITNVRSKDYHLTIRHLIKNGLYSEVKTYHLQHVKPDCTVERLKRIIAQRFAIPVDQQRLLYKTKPLQDRATLEDCGIGNNAIVQLLLNHHFPRPAVEPQRAPFSFDPPSAMLHDVLPIDQVAAPEHQVVDFSMSNATNAP
ncbi:MAG: hypothetical protein LLG04_02395 [Parachlamydia sp.]|nr:hypothetical protein [Parachlamydia sp.]